MVPAPDIAGARKDLKSVSVVHCRGSGSLEWPTTKVGILKIQIGRFNKPGVVCSIIIYPFLKSQKAICHLCRVVLASPPLKLYNGRSAGRLPAHEKDQPDNGSRRDGAVQAWVRALGAMKAIEGQPDITLMSLVREAANGRPDAIALIDRYGQFTYAELEDRSAYYMEWAIAQGVAPGDRVGLLMPKCPDYVAIWFGITQAGGVVALLNTNLLGGGLAHCIRAAAPTHLIVAAEMMTECAPPCRN